jgi:hypothetical protein
VGNEEGLKLFKLIIYSLFEQFSQEKPHVENCYNFNQHNNNNERDNFVSIGMRKD